MDREEHERLNVRKRDRIRTQIDFECPTCRKTVELEPAYRALGRARWIFVVLRM